MVVDLDRWRKMELTSKIESWAQRNQEKQIYSFGCQPPMALAIGEDFESLDGAWNVDGLGWKYEANDKSLIPDDACVLHWTGRI